MIAPPDNLVSPSPTPIPSVPPVLGTPTIQNITIYRKIAKLGVLAANGAEILLPGVGTPAMRSVSVQNGHLDVYDTAADSTVAISSWDVSALTSPFMPSNPLKNGSHTNAVVQDDGDSTNVPDRLPGEKVFALTTDEDADTTIQLGTVFVDDANRIFFTPPFAPLFFPIPDGVCEIECVTHLANNGSVALEWDKIGEDNYHAVTVDIASLEVTSDCSPDDTLSAQAELTWMDVNHLLGKYSGHGFDEYSSINLASGQITNKVSSSNGQVLKVQGAGAQLFSVPVQ